MAAIDRMRSLLLERNVWSPSLEQVMILYLRLCVNIQPGTPEAKDQVAYIKDGLHQYRGSLTSQKEINVTPYDSIVKDLLAQVEVKIEETKKVIEQESVGLDEEAAAALNELKLTPYLRLMAEVYHILIDILKHNKLESLYQRYALQAINFCVKYERKKDFYRLGDILRNHVENLMKGQSQYITTDSIYIHIDVRFAQLNAALQMSLWQEAFRSIEDINTLFGLLSKPKPNVLAAYYQKLAQIYWIAGSHLLHAYALFKHLYYNKSFNTNFSNEDAMMHSSVLLVAALSAPIQEPSTSAQLLQFDPMSQRNINLASLLGLSAYPKRDNLLQEVKRVASSVYPELADLMALFERRTSPLTFSKQLTSVVQFIEQNPQLKQYSDAFQRIIFTKIAIQVGKVYDVIKISEFVKLVPFFDRNEIELLLLNAIKSKLIGARIDHRNGAIHFGHYDFDSANIGDQLSGLALGMRKALRMIDEERKSDASTKAKREIYVKVINNLGDEHRRILARKEIIEKKKIYMEQQERLRRQQEEEQLAAASAAKVEREQALIKENMGRIEKENKESNHSKMVNQTINALDKAKVEMAAKVAKLTKQISYLERAYRHEEVPIIKSQLDTKHTEDRQHFAKQQQEFLRSHREQHDRSVKEKQRMSRMLDDIVSYTATILDKRRQQLPAQQAEQEKRFQKFLEEQAKEQEEKRERKKEQKRIAEEKRAKEEEERKRLALEQQEKERKEQEARANESWSAKRERERREKEERESLTRGTESDSWRNDSAPAKKDEGGWRESPSRDAGGWGDAPRRGGDRDRDFGDQPPRREFNDAPRRGGDDGGWGDKPRGGFGDAPRRGGDDGGWGDKPRGGFGDAPRRDFGDAPRRDRDFGGDAPRRGGDDGGWGDKPRGGFGDAPRRDFGGDAPRRDFGDAPRRDFGDAPRRDFGDAPRRGGDDGGWGDKPRGGGFGDAPRRDFGDAPRRDFGGEPRRGGDFGGDAPRRDFGGEPRRGGDFGGDAPRRDFGGEPRRGGDFGGDRPRRDFGDAPRRGGEEGGNWRNNDAPRGGDAQRSSPNEPPKKEKNAPDADGWTTVGNKRK
ncbi:hypothetical protein SAMD00019534_005430 [Acytostelium subglobosum LB1]|uniref:hypothetical protein n=1 Tax=Acytostelium subglobosum LB1 TaxID=1410327 RepID=UPI00064495CF|nr:hypothetical protein SAMD00019534_005430 [Acytostelium subglobosum LB1]GAM17368.1 hypothetical protein SAMD00019534_005430 [Acytostelium subglobosum LB1]|eukprot:XP_012759430.1 hypothetical protein SAMD00019534_005430 [Acytostelium subglobosum LB1]